MMRHHLTAPGMAVTTRQAVTSPPPSRTAREATKRGGRLGKQPGSSPEGPGCPPCSPAAPLPGRVQGGWEHVSPGSGEAVLSEGRRGCSEVGRGDGRAAGSRASVLGDSSGKNFVLALCPLRVWSPRVAWSAPLPTGRSSASPRCLRVTTAGVLAAVRQAQLPAAGR